ncbi:isocitrate lyase/PEP mutase family protein [Kitasatospora purpeofusca]|uniref:isocitrate lyase/PEP mutase family protein n=1 Tax=Kitasatospora purpeofusca TaxID=67352 RepID=UPI002251D98A|nr:isocitrate lyase/phosphoenolpyruvate mutase family protein [Kitasatospora purpeofusca]MCX4753746.1 isocitrate lyase/phosphoenolpyruvate mutase family protein [Kitasatospora purpeofusca]WSR33226.1 isocitrate lyase/phosphoenolpyruvate mutase family protein [Kitasatospora purpeofusca]
MTVEQREKARVLRELHRPGEPLVLANVWDATSARLVAAAGARALATASASVSWALGSADGEGADRSRVLAQTELIVRAAGPLPVTADLESGFAGTAAGVGGTVEALLATGAVGVNLEDRGRPVAEAAERIAAARAVADAAGVPLFVNGRTDVFLHAGGDADPAELLDEAVARLRAYAEAGADGVFAPGVSDPAVIAALVAAVPAPLNVLAGPGSPSVPELAALGVARISLGPGLAKAAYAAVRRAAEEVYGDGTYSALGGGLDYGELQGLFVTR